MDSTPDFSKSKSKPSSASPPLLHESPVFSYISNLSPIQTAKTGHIAAPGFPGISSPPLVFTSPRVNPYIESSFLKRRSQLLELSGGGTHEARDEGEKCVDGGTVDCARSLTRLRLGLIADLRDSPCSSSEFVDEILADSADVNCGHSDRSVDPCVEHLINSKETTLTLGNRNEDAANSTAEARKYNQGETTLTANPTKSLNQRDDGFRREYHNHDQVLRGEQQDTHGQSPQSLARAFLLIDHVHEVDEAGSEPNIPVENAVMHASKRRCLWFEEAPCNSGKDDAFLSIPEKVSNSKPPTSTAETEMAVSSSVDQSATCTMRQIEASLPPRSTGKPRISVSKPSGIGLHLNSIVNNASLVHDATPIRLADRHMGVQVRKLSSTSAIRCPTSSNMAMNDSGGAIEWMNETESSIAASSPTKQSPLSMEFDHHGSIHDMKISESYSIDSYEECDQSSPTKKRKREISDNDSNGCKRCNCKKSKCLKLYCDCFSSGTYCGTSCACQGCFNKPEYEEMVLETRQKIESRDPLAFAPKVVKHEDVHLFTPASSKHKRGCNCKKSMCLKKYCECYQANVGCSDGCRCEGCQNAYGKRGEFVDVEPGMVRELISDKDAIETTESTFDIKLQRVATRNCSNDSPVPTPFTPSLQCFDVTKSRTLPATCHPSPQSAITVSSHNEEPARSAQRQSENINNCMDTNRRLLEVSSYDWPVNYEITDTLETTTPRCYAIPTTCHLTPLSGLGSLSITSLASSTKSDLINASHVKLRPGSHCLLPGSSLQSRSSPVTPMHQLGGLKSFQDCNPEKGHHDVLQDDTPQILKDTSIPIKPVKVSSPNKKRVSPPHSHIHELGTSSSGALKSGRKFILRAVPSFPPLTPCIDSKDRSTIQNKGSPLQDKD